MNQILHWLLSKPQTLDDLAKENSVSIEELLEQGAVYLNHERLKIMSKESLPAGSYLRIHTNPRRFPIHMVDWKKTIVHENEQYLVIDKPYGIPVHPTLDNFHENVQKALEAKLKTEIFPTHRLDIGTRGLLILAKNKESQRAINQWFAGKQVEKFYEATVEKSPPLGQLEHHMMPHPRVPKKLSRDVVPGWHHCLLQILESHSYEGTHVLKIQLITGRSHQIRAQLAEIGSPIVGDTLYGGKPIDPPEYAGEYFQLKCCELRLPDKAHFFTR